MDESKTLSFGSYALDSLRRMTGGLSLTTVKEIHRFAEWRTYLDDLISSSNGRVVNVDVPAWIGERTCDAIMAAMDGKNGISSEVAVTTSVLLSAFSVDRT